MRAVHALPTFLAAIIHPLRPPPALAPSQVQQVLAAVGGPAPPIGLMSDAAPTDVVPVDTDANLQNYGSESAPAAASLPPAHASAPTAGVSAWSPTETNGISKAQAGTWSPDRFVEAMVAVVFLVLLMYFLLNRHALTPVLQRWRTARRRR